MSPVARVPHVPKSVNPDPSTTSVIRPNHPLTSPVESMVIGHARKPHALKYLTGARERERERCRYLEGAQQHRKDRNSSSFPIGQVTLTGTARGGSRRDYEHRADVVPTQMERQPGRYANT